MCVCVCVCVCMCVYMSEIPGLCSYTVHVHVSEFRTEYNNSVICLYRADNSKNDFTDAGGLNGGIFDTFRSSFSDGSQNNGYVEVQFGPQTHAE